ncbi:MAG: histidinol-phosphatase [Gemmatimonadetes bacterium]|nr:histidinol-phosphatase [Gemmatimonadota bacterium]
MSESLSQLLEFAVEVAWRAGRVTLAHYQTGIAAETKPDESPVTVADREAERLARDLIATRFPHDGILGEEYGAARPDAGRRWLLDPIDGTRSFLRGVPFYGVLVALEEREEAMLGVLHFPALDETVYAARGLGCWWNGRRALVSDVTRLEDAVVLTTDAESVETHGHGAGWDRLRTAARFLRTWGDCYGYALVATGRAEVMVDPVLAPWDAAPLLPVIEEAGGVFTDWDGHRTHRGGHGIATNAALANEVRLLLESG